MTDLDDFRPLTEGRVVVELAFSGGPTETFPVSGPSRPGIFGVDVTPTRPGAAEMAIRVDSKAATDEHRLGRVDVRAPHAAEDHEHPHPHEEGAEETAHPRPGEEQAVRQSPAEEISFLKEQQWTMDFATQVIETARLPESLTVPAKIQPRSGGRIAVTAPIGGRLSTGVRLPVIGTMVQSGQVIAAIVPPTSAPSDLASLELAAEEARVKLDFARQELARVERLLEAGAIPAKRVQETKSQEALALAQLKAAKARIEQYEQTRQADHRDDARTTFQVRSPLSGVVADVAVTDGAHVENGERIIEVVAVDLVYVVGEVPEVEAPSMRRPAGAEVIVPGLHDPMRPGRLISVANFVDPETRTVKVIYELANERRRLAVGQAVTLRLLEQSTQEGPTVPESAIVDDGGRPVVYLQTGGESFERRPVTLGGREAERVLVTSGLAKGERVVTEGAYLVRLASMSSQAPAHGHVH
ncbi:MAG: efflux RND transporter periplasmic adaptor subunit [Acidobacteria bacterium]|nr:efflux RND transporter periplasmic adaptor subunit [Acidobacteriota bacterium]